MYTLAHLSDWHATSLAGCSWSELANKRFLGWLSWRQRRRHRHRPEILRALFEDLEAQGADHVAVTGDLTNVAAVREFEADSELLGALGPPARVSLVPGNHDAYVPVPRSTTWDLWAEYMVSDEVLACREGTAGAVPAPSDDEFPTIRVRGPVALVCVSSAVPTPLGHASGRVGPGQLSRLARILPELRARELCRVVLIHHPVLDEDFTPRRRLVDSAAVRGVLADAGAELVLHGHGHRTLHRTTDGPEGPIPVVGVRSSSHSAELEDRRAQYHLFGIERASEPGGRPFRLRLSTRGYDAASGGFVAEGEESL